MSNNKITTIPVRMDTYYLLLKRKAELTEKARKTLSWDDVIKIILSESVNNGKSEKVTT